jgi:hypothetical protein
MKQDGFPRGWDKKKLGRVLAHYEGQTEEEAVAQDEDAMRSSETVMSVPHDLVPAGAGLWLDEPPSRLVGCRRAHIAWAHARLRSAHCF